MKYKIIYIIVVNYFKKVENGIGRHFQIGLQFRMSQSMFYSILY